MNRQQELRLRKRKSWGRFGVPPIKDNAAVATRLTWILHDSGPGASSRSTGGRIDPSRQDGHQRLVGPPIFLTACGWFLIRQRYGLGLFLMFWGQATKGFADPFRIVCQGWAPTNGTARIGAPFRLRRQGVGASRHGQTQQIRELGQLCQTQKWLKRYKTGMLANLAMFANTFSQNRSPADLVPAFA